ncbi:hypothetical protein [Rubritalea tangerina]|uniref:Uncharacterized protein n=1 Tax=Rubritalea tangerina TaxID=430798 RepID=A0ABW4Z901_9BACT
MKAPILLSPARLTLLALFRKVMHALMGSSSRKLILLPLLLLTSLPTPGEASNASIGIIEQPINLVAQSDPSEIPLGAITFEANYNYGIHELISVPRPCRFGAMEWAQGLELNQNLASAFGILVEPVDSSSVPYEPVNIRIKPWPKPAYSPYTKEQVLIATLHCLMRSTHGTPDAPLVIQIIAEDPKDNEWAKKYARSYVHKVPPGSNQYAPYSLAGSTLKTNQFGITSVHFPQVKAKPPANPNPPVMIAARLGGADSLDDTCALIPVWVGTTWKKPLDASGLPSGLHHDVFMPSTPMAIDSNVLANHHGYLNWSIHQSDEGSSISCGVGDVAERDLAAAIYAAILNIQPSKQKPLTVRLTHPNNTLEELPTFATTKTWIKTQDRHSTGLECTFTLDPKTLQITTGSLPLIKKVEKSNEGPIRITNSSPN